MTRLSASRQMHAAADRMAGAVDRARDGERSRALQSAAATRAAHIAGFPCQTQDEAVRVLRALARETYDRLADLMGALPTACLYESLARKDVHLAAIGGRARVRAEAEKAFRPANDAAAAVEPATDFRPAHSATPFAPDARRPQAGAPGSNGAKSCS